MEKNKINKELTALLVLTGLLLVSCTCSAEVIVSSITTDKASYYPGEVVKFSFNISIINETGGSPGGYVCELTDGNVIFKIINGNSLRCVLPTDPINDPLGGVNYCGSANINLTAIETEKYPNRCQEYSGSNLYYYVIYWKIPLNWSSGTYTAKADVNASSAGKNDTSEMAFNILNCDNDSDRYNSTQGSCNGTDCNDINPGVHPGASEICDGIDNNCNGVIDEGCGGSSRQPQECGNHACETKENYTNCPVDCLICGDKKCEGNETYEICPKDCEKPPECTTDSNCTESKICKDKKCVEKPPECTTDSNCTEGKICKDKKCVESMPCGDGKCRGNETYETCPGDCPVCGDKKCQGSETYETCPGDCPVCGDKKCQGSETYETCPKDCLICGDGKCEGNETYETCPKDCLICGDGKCEGSETYETCREDCLICGDGKCEGNETCETCEADCRACPKLTIDCTKETGVDGTITCTVTDENGKPVSGATVTLTDGRTAVTNNDGKAEFPANKAGEIDASAGKTGYVGSDKAPILVTEKGCFLFNIQFFSICWYWWLLLILILILIYYYSRRKK